MSNTNTQLIGLSGGTPGTQKKLAVMKENRVSDLLKSGVRFKEHFLHLEDMIARPTAKYDKKYGRGSKKNLANTAIEFNGGTFFPSQRFWTSFCAKVGVGTNIFNLFSQAEVLNRTVMNSHFSESGNVRVIEDCQSHQLLAITEPTKPVVDWASVLKLVDRKGGYDVRYKDGIISAMHSLESDLDVKVGAEDFKQRISVHIPIDGYGAPAVYLALMRQVCSNGMVAMSKAFKTSINVGKKDSSCDVEFALERMYDSYSNDEGFDALIRRLETARRSKLSVREFEHAQRFLARIPAPKDDISPLKISKELRKFSNMAGNLHSKYGLASLQQMSDKQMSLLETDMTVYEAVNFMTEVTSHRLDPRRKIDNTVIEGIQGWVGSLVSKSYDLENVIDLSDAKSEFTELYFDPSNN